MSHVKIPFKLEWWDTGDFKQVLHDQAFGFELCGELCAIPDMHPPQYSDEKFEEHERILSNMDTGFTEVFNRDDEFEVHLNVRPFKMDNITVTSLGDSAKVTCEHFLVTEGQGEVRRKLKRIYILPKSCDPRTLKAYIRHDGALVLNCKKGDRHAERVIPLGLSVC